jgi:hypothetical protein
MRQLTMLSDELYDTRPMAIGRMLIAFKGRPVPCQEHPRLVRYGKMFAAHDGGMRPETNRDEWRFRTLCARIQCEYSEVWKYLENGRRAYLDKAHLHLFEIDRLNRTEREIVAVHAEWQEEEPSSDVEWCKALHLHIVNASHPMPKCHFPFTISHHEYHTQEVLSSLENLTSVFTRVISAIWAEISSRYG